MPRVKPGVPHKKPGPKPKDPAGAKTPCSVKLSPTQQQILAADFGSVNAGVQSLVEKYQAEKPMIPSISE